MPNKYKPFEYKKEDVDCKLCLYYAHGFCCSVRCCCLEEKLKLDSPILALLIYASIKDIKSREVPDSVSGMMLILGLVGITAEDLPSMLLGMALVFLPQYLAAIINPAKALGGADIKLSSAAAFLLGAPRGLFALIVGLTLSVITVPIVRAVKKLPKNQPFPLVPFLAVGIIAAYLI